MATNKAAAPQAEIVETEVTNSASYGRRVDYSGCASITIDPVKGKGVDGGNFNVVIATLEDGQTITLNLSDEQLNAFHNVSEEGVLFLTLINAKVSDGYRTEGWKLLSCARANKASASAFSVRLQTSAVQAGKMDAVISNRNRFTSFDKGEMDIVSMLLRI